MTPNDKLPEEISSEINLSANAFASGMYPNFQKERERAERIYTVGATAWAPWKVKHDELQAQAQRMADALEAFILWQGSTLKNWPVMEKAHEALQQFKDGGKEVKPEHNVSIGEHITYCHDCGFPVDECNCIDK